MINLRIKSYFSYFKKVWRRDTWIYSAKWKSAWVTSISYCNVLQAEKCMCVLKKIMCVLKNSCPKIFLPERQLHSLRRFRYNFAFALIQQSIFAGPQISSPFETKNSKVFFIETSREFKSVLGKSKTYRTWHWKFCATTFGLGEVYKAFNFAILLRIKRQIQIKLKYFEKTWRKFG